MDEFILILQKELRENADENILAERGKRAFKEEIRGYGIKTPQLKKITKKHLAMLKGKSKEDVFGVCEKLWKSGLMEEEWIAAELAYSRRKEYTPQDFSVFAGWVATYVNNWASCDTLCNHSVGAIVESFPNLIGQLKSWSNSTNRWVRRGSAVSLIIPARKGRFLKDIFEISDSLLEDGDDLVQKGYGWLLKAASQAHPAEVFDYVMSKKHLMPRTALRYSIEKMPPEWRAKAMAK